jgi:NAD(P)-dependent dehydrogenase (short-subunit alcohol dehydrogenase family)
MMDWELSGKAVLVTGAAGGIGSATVEMLLGAGARVAAVDLEKPEAGSDGDFLPLVEDLSTADGCKAAVAAAAEAYGDVGVLVNNVGIGPARPGFLSVPDEEWARTFELNFMSMVRICREAIPGMVEKGEGSIVNVSSAAARQVEPAVVDYAASKAAMLNTSKALANEFGPQGVRSNVVTPGPTRTPMWDRPGAFVDHLAERYSMEREAALDYYAKEVRKIPTGRLGAPADVAAVIVFLASPLSRQVTGADYRVDGGSVFYV